MDAFYAGVAIGFGILLFHESKILAKKSITGARFPTASLPNAPVGPIADDCGCCGGGSVAPSTTEIVRITPGISIKSPNAPGFSSPSNTNAGRGYFYANAAPSTSPATYIGGMPSSAQPTAPVLKGSGTGFADFGTGMFN